jgi:hypothetical protein
VDGLQLLEELARLAGPVGRLPVLVAGDLGVGAVGNKGVQVLGPQSTQPQPRCGQGREGGIQHGRRRTRRVCAQVSGGNLLKRWGC